MTSLLPSNIKKTIMPQLENFLLYEHAQSIIQNKGQKRNCLTSLHIAVLVKRGKIIETAMNSLGSRARGAGYSGLTIHAERAVVKKLGDISKLRGCTMYVWRVGFAEFYPMSSEPCSECVVFLNKCKKQYGLREVYFTHTNTISVKPYYNDQKIKACECSKN